MDKEADAERGAVLYVGVEEEIGGDDYSTKGGPGGPGAAHQPKVGADTDILPVKRATLERTTEGRILVEP